MYEMKTGQASVTGSCPFRDCSRKFVYRPQNIWSADACPIHAFSDDVRANLCQFSHRFLVFLLEAMIIKTWRGDFITQLLHCFVCLFGVPFHALLRMSCHVVGPHDSICTTFLRMRQMFKLLLQSFAIPTFFCVHRRDFCSVYVRVECISSTLDQET